MTEYREPFVCEIASPPDPLTACERLAHLRYRLLFDSAVTGERQGRYSYLVADPSHVIRARGHRVDVQAADGPWYETCGGLVDQARRWLRSVRARHREDLPPFQGGIAGYVAYDWGRTLERLPPPRLDDLGLPDAVLGVYDWVVAWDHVAGGAWIVSTGRPDSDADTWTREAAERADAVAAVLRKPMANAVAWPSAPASVPLAACPSVPLLSDLVARAGVVRSTFSADEYRRAVRRVRDYVHAGDLFQANLSQRFEAPLSEPPWSFYRRLREHTPAPFGAYIELPDATILSMSPERFLQVDPRRRVETRPIKGTRPRGVGPEHDAALGPALLASDKDRAENLMIVDLMRNDLSKVCSPGSVRVSELFAVERYATVQHLVSTVVGALQPGADALSLLHAAFPGGSVTGAPKVRAMEVIAELEPTARGVYCGSIGYWGFSGASDTSIAIRTAVAKDGRVTFSAGGGVVADSDPDREYVETLDKARGFIEAVGAMAP